MKPSDVEAIYKSLEDGLGQCFLYGQDPFPCKISADKIHIALDSLKYHVFVEKRKEQVQLEREALGTIFRKPELYCVPLKRAPMPRGGLEDKGSELILHQNARKRNVVGRRRPPHPLVRNRCPLVHSRRPAHLSSVHIHCGEGGAWVGKAQILHGI